MVRIPHLVSKIIIEFTVTLKCNKRTFEPVITSLNY